MPEDPRARLQAAIDAQRLQREAAITTSKAVSEALDKAAKEAAENAPQQ
jgi:hypothetical protein